MVHSDHHPQRLDLVVFAAKAQALRWRRSAADLMRGEVRRFRRDRWASAGRHLAEVITPLYTDSDVHEQALQLGKVQNLRVGARALDGLFLPQGQIFSFWAHIGRPTRSKGFVEGRELRQGCLIPTLAGGLCQLSNSLHVGARRAGCDIIERHGHSAPIPNSPFPEGEDATVFWNYVDLRFRPKVAMVLRVRLSATDLIVRLEAA